jgi:hypothetical protein
MDKELLEDYQVGQAPGFEWSEELKKIALENSKNLELMMEEKATNTIPCLCFVREIHKMQL